MFEQAFNENMRALGQRIANVRWHGEGNDVIAFVLDGVPYVGALKGRNRDLILTGEAGLDRAIARRVLVDGDAREAR